MGLHEPNFVSVFDLVSSKMKCGLNMIQVIRKWGQFRSSDISLWKRAVQVTDHNNAFENKKRAGLFKPKRYESHLSEDNTDHCHQLAWICDFKHFPPYTFLPPLSY